MKLSAVIVYFQNMPELYACLDSLRCADVEIVVVDTSPGSDAAHNNHVTSRVTSVVECPDNRGYGWACNTGIHASTGDVVVVSNSDVVYEPGTLAALELVVKRTLGLAAPLQVDEASMPNLDNLIPPVQWRYALARWLGVGRARMNRVRRAMLGRDHGEILLVSPWALSGACLAATREVWTSLDGFDERIWMYFEDVDLSRRAAEAQIATCLLLSARIRHTSGSNKRELSGSALSAALWGEQIAFGASGRRKLVLRLVQTAGCLVRLARFTLAGDRRRAALWLSGMKYVAMGRDCDPRTVDRLT